MYTDFRFAEKSKVELFTDMNEAIKRSYEVTVEPIPAFVDNIQVSSKGGIVFNGEEKPITERGLESFFKVLGIPPQFARKIPTELLLHNVQKLTNDNPAQPIFVLQRPDGNLSSIVKDPYTEIPYADILGRFSERHVKSISMSENLLKCIFTFDQLKVPDLDDNQDTLYVGEYLVSSLTKLISLQAVGGLYRTQCENSFIMPIFGAIKANYMKEPDVRLARFADAFECYDNDIIATVFRNFAQKKNSHLKEHQVKIIWERLSKIFSKSDADNMFGFDDDSRNTLLSNAKGYLSEVKHAKALNLEIPEPSNTVFNAYDISNSITLASHERMHDEIDQWRGEILGGNILQWMTFSNN